MGVEHQGFEGTLVCQTGEGGSSLILLARCGNKLYQHGRLLKMLKFNSPLKTPKHLLRMIPGTQKDSQNHLHLDMLFVFLVMFDPVCHGIHHSNYRLVGICSS